MANIAMVLNRPRNESARNPPSKHSKNEVPMKSVTVLAASALGKCMVPLRYVTKFTAIPIVDSLSHISIPGTSLTVITRKYKIHGNVRLLNYQPKIRAAGTHPPVLVLSAGLPL